MSTDFEKKILESIREIFGYEELTLVQKRVLDYFRRRFYSENSYKKDLLVIAPTGSGKTLAILMPILIMILSRKDLNPIKILYITPLRALNRDLFDRLYKLFESFNLSIAIWHGDTSYNERRRIRENPPIMLITTPESLQYILINEDLKSFLYNISYVIIDEIQELIDDERGCEVSVALERLKDFSKDFMRIGLSGTIGEPDLVGRFLSGVGGRYDVIDVSSEKNFDIDVILPSSLAIMMRIIYVEAIEDLLKKIEKPVLIFVNTRDEAEHLGSLLSSRGLRIYVHHGSLSKDKRLEAERKLKEGSIDAVIATSSLELGIDVGLLKNVIQVRSPRQVTKIVQRIGRSGHREKEISKGFVVTSRNIFDIAESIVIARRGEEASRRKDLLEKPLIRRNPLDVLMHQVVGILLQYKKSSKEKIMSIIKRSYCFKDLSEEILDELLRFMIDMRMIRKDQDGLLEATGRGRIYYYSTTMIVDTKKYDVINTLDKKEIGALDEEFVIRSLNPDEIFVLAGGLWRVLNIEEDKIFVEPAKKFEGKIPRWIGQQIPVERNVAREVCSLLNLVIKDLKPSKMFWEDRYYEYLREILSKEAKVSEDFELGDKKIFVEKYSDEEGYHYVFMYPCLGTRGNRALSYYIQNMIRKIYGIKTISGSTSYAVVLISDKNVDPIVLSDVLSKKISKDDLIKILEESIESSDDMRWYIVSVARKMGALEKEVSLKEAKKYADFYRDTIIWREALNEALQELFDVDVLYDFLEKIWSRNVPVIIRDRKDDLSIFARASLEVLSGFNRVFEKRFLPEDLLIEIVKRRLYEKEVELICLMCGHVFTRKIKDLQDPLTCERCGSVLLAYNKYRDERSRMIVKKMIRSLSTGNSLVKTFSSLSDEEKEILKMLRETASLIASNGRKALYVLAGTGIGPETARRILSKHNDERELLRLIIEAETKFYRTREYWEK